MYYVTICAQNKMHWFGQVADGRMNLNDFGKMVDSIWAVMPREFPIMELDEWMVMPNDFHAIFHFVGAPLVGALRETNIAPTTKRAGTRPAPTGHAPTVGEVVGAFKSFTTDEYIRGVHQHGWKRFDGKIWQRDFYDHIIHNGDELDIIRDYIRTNPQRWDTDPEFT